VGDDDELGLVLLDEGGDVVKAELKVAWLGGLSGSGLSLLLQSLLLVLSGLWGVFTEKLKDFASLVLVNSVGELVDGRGDLESLHQDSLLPLNSDVSWPFDETGEVSLWLDVSSNSEVSGSLLEKRCLTGTASRCVALRLDNLLSFNSFLYL